MLRSILRWPRSIRVPINQDGPIEVRRVSVTRARRQVSRLVLTSFFVFCAIRSTEYWMPDSIKRPWNKVFGDINVPSVSVKNDTPEDVYQNTAAGRKSDDNGRKGKDQTALKLPVWIRMKRQRMYTETDEEWMTFARLQGDPTRVLEVKKEVAKYIGKQLIKPQHLGNLRHIGWTGKVSAELDIVPPLFPPDGYEVPAVLLGSKGISVGWVPLPESQGATMSRIFHPVVFGQAFYAGFKAYAYISYCIYKARVQDYFQLDNITEIRYVFGETDPAKKQAMEDFKKPTNEAMVKAALGIGLMSDKDMKAILPFLRGKYGEGGEARRQFRDVVKSLTNEMALEHAMAIFHHAWVTGQFQTLQNTQPRGSLQVRGFVNCLGQRGKYRVEVVAFYMPKDNAFIGRPVILNHYLVKDFSKFTKDKPQKLMPVEPGVMPQASAETSKQASESTSGPVVSPPPPEKEEGK